MQEALASGVVAPRWLIWVSAKNRSTGEVETAGFWTGEDDLSIEIDGQPRTYTGAGATLAIGDLTYEAGLDVQAQRISLSILAPEVEEAIRTFDARLAPVEVHMALFDPENGAEIGTSRAFSGWIEEAPIKQSAKGSAVCELSLMSSSRAGTRTLGVKKSSASQRLRASTDRGRDYADLSGEVSVTWG